MDKLNLLKTLECKSQSELSTVQLLCANGLNYLDATDLFFRVSLMQIAARELKNQPTQISELKSFLIEFFQLSDYQVDQRLQRLSDSKLIYKTTSEQKRSAKVFRFTQDGWKAIWEMVTYH